MKRGVLFGLVWVVTLTGLARGDWKSEANARIEQIRKRDAKITIVDRSGNPVSGVTVNLQQTKHRFGFGSAIRYQSNQTYYSFFKDHFEWAVPENELKWWHDEPTQNNYNYTGADFLAEYCRTNGLKMRAHNIFWGGSIPDWVGPLYGSALQTAMDGRINSVVNRYEGKTLHWDVYNEILNGSMFEQRLGSAIKYWMFQRARQEDPTVKLFVNEVGVESSDALTGQLVTLVQDLQAHGCDVGGIGLQGHVDTIDPYAYKARLDTISQLGLPIWVTEFTSGLADDNARADVLEQVYRTSFSHPSVEGILMWGFWAGEQGVPGWYIANQDFTLNATGQRYASLINEWTTNHSGVSNSAGEVNFSGFHGTYEVTLVKDGKSLCAQPIELEPGTGQAQYAFSLPILIDDFEDGQVDATIWDISRNGGGTFTESNGKLTLASVDSNRATLFSQTKIYPVAEGVITLRSAGVNFGYYLKGNEWGFYSPYDGANYITLFTNDDNGALWVKMGKNGATQQHLVVGGGSLNEDARYTISWSLNRVVITKSDLVIFDTGVNTVDADGNPWRIPNLPMAAYAQSGWNGNSISFTEMEMQTTGSVHVLSRAVADDFEDGVINTSLWSTLGNLGTITESGGLLTLQSVSSQPARLTSTFAMDPRTDGMVVLSTSGMNIGFWTKTNQWGLATPTNSDCILLVMNPDNGGMNLVMSQGGAGSQTFDLGTGNLESARPYAICWTAGRVVVMRDNGVLFDTAVNTTDANGIAWRIPAVPMGVCVQTGWNSYAISLADMKIETTETAQVLARVFSDDFEDGNVNPALWDISVNGGSSITESGGVLTLASGSGNLAYLRSIPSADIAGGKTAILTSLGVNFGWYTKGNEWGLHDADDGNFISLYTEDDSKLTLYMRSGGGNVQALALCDESILGGYVPFMIRWSAGQVVVTKGGATLFDTVVNTTDNNGVPWAIPAGPMKVHARSGWNSNAIFFTDMTLQVTGVPGGGETIPALSVTPSAQNVPASAGTTTFTVNNTGGGTMPWTATVTEGISWLAVTSGTSGTNSGTITATFTANSGAQRVGTIHVDAGAAGTRDVTVTQASGQIQGTVVHGTVTYTDFAGFPLNTVTIEIRSGATVVETHPDLALTGNVGSKTYTFTPTLTGGPYTLAIVKNAQTGWKEAVQSNVTIAGDTTVNFTVTHTLAGDASMDNKVDVSDLGILAANYGQTGKTWSQGDFSGDGKVDVSDLGILAAHYGQGSGGATQAGYLPGDMKALGLSFDSTTPETVDTQKTQTEENPVAKSLGGCGSAGLPLIAGIFLAGLLLSGLKIKS